MKYSDTTSRKDEYQQEMNHQRTIHTGNSYQKTEWREMETYGVLWCLSWTIKKKQTHSYNDEMDMLKE
jgi:hypothetical protein